MVHAQRQLCSSSSADQLYGPPAAGTDAQTIVDMEGAQDTSLEVAGFAGAVAEAYASYNYV